MKQRTAITSAHERPARAAFAILAAGMAISACDLIDGGPSGMRGRSPRIAESAASGASSPKSAASAQKNADAGNAASAASKGAQSKLPQTARERLLSAATSRVWEIRERINASPEQDLHITVTLSVGAGGHPVSVMGATASTGRGGASRDVADILALDMSGLTMPGAGAKRTTTESVIIKGE
ncbi:hypothetical protein L0Y65_05300 [Candidatus Micrarchaeota archaeon]|nr:hypothetical protein [Candidatus Micrarchaeota archaeon]